MGTLGNIITTVLGCSLALWLILDGLKADDRAKRVERNREKRRDRAIPDSEQH